MVWLWRSLLIFLMMLWLWHRLAPVRWHVLHNATWRLAWMMMAVFAVAFAWRLWEIWGR